MNNYKFLFIYIHVQYNNLCQDVSQGTTVQTAQSCVLILPMVTDVRDTVTVTRSAVMLLQDAGLRPPVLSPVLLYHLKLTICRKSGRSTKSKIVY